jgi:hypothetical protein
MRGRLLIVNYSFLWGHLGASRSRCLIYVAPGIVASHRSVLINL